MLCLQMFDSVVYCAVLCMRRVLSVIVSVCLCMCRVFCCNRVILPICNNKLLCESCIVVNLEVNYAIMLISRPHNLS